MPSKGMHYINLMAGQGGSKFRLDTPLRRPQPWAVKRVAAVVAVLTGTVGPAAAQAPDWAVLWRVAASTLPAPAALAGGPTAVFWNPAAVHDLPGLAAGLEVLHTPDVVSLSGVLAAVTYRVGDRLSLGAIGGRLGVSDLVRTSTSPVVEGTEIQAYAQFLGGVVGGGGDRFAGGAVVLLHDARLDQRNERGATIDLGVRGRPTDALTLAAATHLATLPLEARPTTEYTLGAEYRVGSPRLWGLPGRVLARYGVSFHADGPVEHHVSGGLAVGDRLRVDLGLRQEAGYGNSAWRPVLGLTFRAGRYVVGVARSSGMNDVGAAYRIGLNAGFLP